MTRSHPLPPAAIAAHMPLYDAHGAEVGRAGQIRIEQVLRGDAAGPRCVARVTFDAQTLLMKLRCTTRWRRRVAICLGRGRLRHEAHMLERARALHLDVPAIVARGWHGVPGHIAQELLLLDWLQHGVSLHDWVGATAGPRRARARACIARLMARVRRAGVADSDFGAHNILVQRGESGPDHPVWVDLEAAFACPPDHARGTVAAAAAALANWWVCSRCDQDEVQHLFDMLRDALPPPRGGWPRAMRALHGRLTHRCAKQVRCGRIDKLPDPLRVAHAQAGTTS